MREQMVGDGLVVREHVPIWPWKPCLCAARGLAGVGALMPTDHSRLTRHASPPSRRRLASHRLWREHDVIKSELGNIPSESAGPESAHPPRR